jgi:hypothetical protein
MKIAQCRCNYRDFDDGNYFEQSDGAGTALVQRLLDIISDRVTFREEIVETSLDPLIRKEQILEDRQERPEQTVTNLDQPAIWIGENCWLIQIVSPNSQA